MTMISTRDQTSSREKTGPCLRVVTDQTWQSRDEPASDGAIDAKEVRQVILSGQARHGILDDRLQGTGDIESDSDAERVHSLTVTLGDQFIQVLEGSEEQISQALIEIDGDQRHNGIKTNSDRLHSSGEFSRWTGETVNLDDINLARVMRWFRVSPQLSVDHLDVDDIFLWLSLSGTIAAVGDE